MNEECGENIILCWN